MRGAVHFCGCDPCGVEHRNTHARLRHCPSGPAGGRAGSYRCSGAGPGRDPLTDKIVWETGNRYTFRLRACTCMQVDMRVSEAAALKKKRWASVNSCRLSGLERRWRKPKVSPKIGPGEDSFCRLCSPIAWLWGNKTVFSKSGEAKNGPLRPICSRRFPRSTASWCGVSRLLAHKKASFRPWRCCQSSRYHPASLRFAPCQNQKPPFFICASKRETLH
jgi:hypothetical protein